MILIYDDLETCENDLKTIYKEMILKKVKNGKLYNKKTKKHEEPTDEINSDKYPILGYKKGKINYDSGFTLAWDKSNIMEDGRYYIACPTEYEGLSYSEIKGYDVS